MVPFKDMMRCTLLPLMYLYWFTITVTLLPSSITTTGWMIPTTTTTTVLRISRARQSVSQPHSLFRRVLELHSQPQEEEEKGGEEPFKDVATTTTTTTSTIAPPKVLDGVAAMDDSIDDVDDDDEKPAGIVGAQFFGGNKQKEELYDPVAEMEAGVEEWSGFYDRFLENDDGLLMEDAQKEEEPFVASLCRSLQEQIRQILQQQPSKLDATSSTSTKKTKNLKKPSQKSSSSLSSPTSATTTLSPSFYYAPNLVWETPPLWQTTKQSTTTASTTNNYNPLQALQQAMEFYNRLDVAIVSGTRLSNTQVEVRWEISVVWPTFWEPRVLLTGTSRLTVDTTTRLITRQTDVVDDGTSPDLLQTILQQLLPRFWDLYHIGMTPSAELSSRFTPTITITSSPSSLSFLSALLPKSYQVYELPPRWMLQATRLDTGDRDDAVAQVVPNHVFTTIIKTVGPQRQRYVPTSPVQIQIVQPTKTSSSSSSIAFQQPALERGNGDDDNDNDPDTNSPLSATTTSSTATTTSSSNLPQIIWKIPLSVEFLSQARWPLPGEDPEAELGSQPSCRYVLDPRRRIATLAFGKSPQDPAVAQARKRLFDAVTRDGYQPKLDTAGRPQFFYLQHDCKACFTGDGGLGMTVYEWRPEWVQTNEIGIELEL